jgi:hypothetical protein
VRAEIWLWPRGPYAKWPMGLSGWWVLPPCQEPSARTASQNTHGPEPNPGETLARPVVPLRRGAVRCGIPDERWPDIAVGVRVGATARGGGTAGALLGASATTTPGTVTAGPGPAEAGTDAVTVGLRRSPVSSSATSPSQPGELLL